MAKTMVQIALSSESGSQVRPLGNIWQYIYIIKWLAVVIYNYTNQHAGTEY